MISQARFDALILLVKTGKVKIQDIKNEEYKQAVISELENDE